MTIEWLLEYVKYGYKPAEELPFVHALYSQQPVTSSSSAERSICAPLSIEKISQRELTLRYFYSLNYNDYSSKGIPLF